MTLNLKGSFEVENFLDEHELNFVKTLCDKIPNSENSGNEFHAYTNGFDYNFLPPSIKNKITDCIGSQNVTVSMILKEYHPWAIHTDYPKDDVFLPSWALLIPIDFSNVTHTVIFPQQEKESFKNFKTHNKKLNHNYTQHQLDLLSHISQDDLAYVSDPMFYEWKPGKLIAWERDLLHTSDNFKIKKDDYKIALVAFFSKDD